MARRTPRDMYYNLSVSYGPGICPIVLLWRHDNPSTKPSEVVDSPRNPTVATPRPATRDIENPARCPHVQVGR